MARAKLSTKRIAIDKANARMVIIVGVAAFVSVFCLIASKTLMEQRSYQGKVISKKEKARDQLKSNVQAVKQLSVAYQQFAAAQPNVIGGNKSGNGERDGDNPRIVLDALPSKYDFPALATSVEKLASINQLKLDDIKGTDDEVGQATNQSSSLPQPQEIPFSAIANMSQESLKPYLELFERSIRPFQFQKLIVTSNPQNNELKVEITAKSYYQPSTSLDIKKETVR